MTSFKYLSDNSGPLSRMDLYSVFNRYRFSKYMIQILLNLNKKNISEYKFLEPGCGSGEKLRFLTELRAQPQNCYGFDISEQAIKACRLLSPGTMNFALGSVFDPPFKGVEFDIILCSGLFDCFSDDGQVRQISRSLHRMITKEGLLFVVDINENFHAVYGGNRAVMEKGLRPYDSKKGVLESLLGNEFQLFRHSYLFGADYYFIKEGILAEMEHLPFIDNKMDQQAVPCAYSLWVFTPKKEEDGRT